jgi:DNA-binding HxlR family transcriptional regulator
MNPEINRGIEALAREMAAHGTSREAPVRQVMALLGDRWSTLILLVLATGEWRHVELRKMLTALSSEQAISQRVLTLKLRTLERDGFVARDISADTPPKVAYRLAPLGHSLHAQARAMIGWVQDNGAAIEAARAQFAARVK